MSDYISRADAIEAVRKKLQDWGSYAFEDYRRGLYEAQDIIEALPSADAEWIPCSNGLPSESGNYLITVADLRLGHNGEHTVTMADFYAKAKKWNSIVDVYAWMPLPKPYREDGE